MVLLEKNPPMEVELKSVILLPMDSLVNGATNFTFSGRLKR
jgi:hypothetical protein